ncbi:MAG TPA: Nmad5 family putative nucleotide modification protein [Aquabacterium sp.]|nr:Nmad5 family putative nucleotide modification protein [Aquabacterium sp.]
MKLTNYMRDAFINSVMDDVPKTGFGEDVRKLVHDDIVAQMPPAAQKAYKDKASRDWVRVESYTFGAFSVSVPTNTGRYGNPPTLTKDAEAKLDEFKKAAREQKEKLENLRSRLKSAAYGCTTRKALAELLPEFEKYLPPEDGAASRALPVVANMVTDFVKAGWPKKKAA